MRDRADSCASEDLTAGTSTEAPTAETPRALPVAFPLDDFYIRAGLRLPAIETLKAADIPEPYRSLLAHSNDMTPTLSAYHARIIHLRVLGRRQRGDFYFREVVLVADETEQTVEFGAIRINLALFTPVLRRHIINERVPLGQLLRTHSVPHSSRPKAFFRLKADALMIQSLQLEKPHILFGRRNTLLDASQRPMAEVVEILPPLPASPPGFISQS